MEDEVIKKVGKRLDRIDRQLRKRGVIFNPKNPNHLHIAECVARIVCEEMLAAGEVVEVSPGTYLSKSMMK